MIEEWYLFESRIQCVLSQAVTPTWRSTWLESFTGLTQPSGFHNVWAGEASVWKADTGNHGHFLLQAKQHLMTPVSWSNKWPRIVGQLIVAAHCHSAFDIVVWNSVILTNSLCVISYVVGLYVSRYPCHLDNYQ